MNWIWTGTFEGGPVVVAFGGIDSMTIDSAAFYGPADGDLNYVSVGDSTRLTNVVVDGDRTLHAEATLADATAPSGKIVHVEVALRCPLEWVDPGTPPWHI
jgi:hypothetical protein